ncbi:MFS general substrate transporter [Daedalea quercina L-15889]|uniref:MFS general substrate transporter n=1 Tax=Daedalea quercina L-15889 TaxID=1314783 RepID=A0A165LKG4_9APHY|nr:MFS general substrate transporter [Daedalea quercina L-15889]
MQETSSIDPDPALSANRRAIYRRNGRIHFAALCYASFLNGWNDGSTGPLLPTIEHYYHIGFAVVSLLFVTNCLGFLSGAVANVWSNHRFGIGKVYSFRIVPSGAIVQLIGYSMMAPGGPFPIMCIGFACAGLGLSLQNAQANGFVGSLKEDTRIKFGFLHAAYGLGALVAPLVATHFASSAHWSFHYLVSIGGWIVTFVEDKRGGGASAGYISSGFFAGLMLGRIVLMQLNRKLGERWVIVYYSLIVIILEVTIWVVPSLIENAIAVSFVGLLMGPIYPILMNHSSMILPMRLLTGCVGYIGAIGLTGSAVLPFITAVISSKFGIASLQPFIVSMVSTMIIIWALVPKVRRIE